LSGDRKRDEILPFVRRPGWVGECIGGFAFLCLFVDTAETVEEEDNHELMHALCLDNPFPQL
jgi:hypothetical protein